LPHHADAQREYYDRAPDRSRLVPNSRHSTLRHFERGVAALGVSAPARILDLGAGMGRFSLLLAETGYRVTALDLSAELLQRLRARDPQGSVEVHVGDAEQADRLFARPFDAVAGFFFLHHLADATPTFRAVRALLPPGGRAVFCEPNSWNPSFYLQVLFSRTMTFRGEAGLTRMRRGPLERAARDAGLQLRALERYGLLPPAIADRRGGARLDRALAAATPPILRAFQTVVLERPA
jgi:2-polyprenyl-3-methyl-5-hydroxy-6-metoxy-1,4-benzoquinol methylase